MSPPSAHQPAERRSAKELIEPIGAAQRERVCRRTETCIDRAGRAYGRRFAPIPVHFDLKGRAAGMYRVDAGARRIRYNPYLFAKYFEDNLAVTVPHEVAHYVVDMLYGLRRVRAHGPEWREVMAVLGANPRVTCDYDLDGVPQRRQRRHPYACDCRRHLITTRRRNAIERKKARYQCKYCGTPLRPEPAATGADGR
jgi:SprT protein